MRITEPRADHAENLLSLYTGSVRLVPHCRFLPSLVRFSYQLLGTVAVPSLYTLPREQLRLVAEDVGEARGFAALTRYQDFDGAWYQAITGLFFADEEAGRELVRACEAAAAPGELFAFPQSHGKTVVSEYNGGWDGLSDRVPDVACVLTAAGYVPFYRELHLSLDLRRFPPAPHAPPAGICLRHELDERGRDSIRAMAGDEEAGSCGFGTQARLAEDPLAARVGYVWWLGVDEAHRRRGLARALVTAALARLAEHGCDEVWLTTGADNWPAQPLYLSLGFVPVDCSACFRRELRAAQHV